MNCKDCKHLKWKVSKLKDDDKHGPFCKLLKIYVWGVIMGREPESPLWCPLNKKEASK